MTSRAAVWLLAAAVVALQIPYPLVHGHAGNVLTVTTVLVFATASVTHAVLCGRVRQAVALLVVVVVGGFVAEAVGVHTGVPFGRYRYTGGLGLTLLDVPVVVPLAWVMMAHPAATVAARVSRGPARVVVGAAALMSWDVFLDPQMVGARHWRWSHPSPHLPGITDVPLSNFAGWILVSLVLMALLHVATAGSRVRDDGPMVALWLWTWLSSTLANLAFFDRPAVAAWGFAAMALVGLPLLRTLVGR